VGKGVCGTAVATGEDQNVPDVRAIENYIACNAWTRSELVVLIRRGATILGQIDVDSDEPDPFTPEEAAEDTMPKGEPLGRLERPCGWAKHHVGKEHAAHPDDGGKHMKRDEQRHAPRLSQDSALGVSGRKAFLL
jgi:hypothetical protein